MNFVKLHTLSLELVLTLLANNDASAGSTILLSATNGGFFKGPADFGFSTRLLVFFVIAG